MDSRNTSANTIQAPYWWINSFITPASCNSESRLLRFGWASIGAGWLGGLLARKAI
jgi:hypothetical protein